MFGSNENLQKVDIYKIKNFRTFLKLCQVQIV